MSAPSLPTTTAVAGGILPPAILDLILNGFADALRSPLELILVCTILASWLLPLLIALFYFSTPASRRQTIFILNVITVLVGIGMTIWSNYLLVWLSLQCVYDIFSNKILVMGNIPSDTANRCGKFEWICYHTSIGTLAFGFSPCLAPFGSLSTS